jgi:predicted phosphohydrolase
MEDLAMNQNLILVGDFQRTTLIERLIGREQNDIARFKLAHAVVSERPEQICFLGDMTAYGGIRGAWKAFDDAFSELSTPVQNRYAICGNHDYWGKRFDAVQELENRFANLKPLTYGRFRFKSVSILYLNSNHKILGTAECALQREWFLNALIEDDGDSSIQHTLVLIHHPPFTQAKGRESKWVETNFVAPFLAAKKTRAMMSGHAHTYEHFSKEGKLFLVCGSAGGPRVNLPGVGKSPFHFVKVKDLDSVLSLEIVGFQNVDDAVGVLDRIATDFARTN